MYSEDDLQHAVAAGAISAEAARALRDHVARLRQNPIADEEHFRLLTGFNDIFVAIACIILLVAVGSIGMKAGPGGPDDTIVSGLMVTGASWGLAEYFTRRRRMALPSILLLIGFIGGIVFAAGSLAMALFPDTGTHGGALIMAGVAACGATGAWLHWRRFAVPITVAAGAAAAATVIGGLLLSVLPDSKTARDLLLLAAGLAIFTLAMKWDMTDRSRSTRRSDVAFWLHLTAAPMIAHSLFQLLGVFGQGQMGMGKALMVIALYIAFGFVALAIDRRALLVSSLAYVLYALYTLFQQAGAVELSAAFTALVIGSSLLLLSALWQRARGGVVQILPPALGARLPHLERPPAATPPA
ncbi:MAG: hypothetical protein AB7E60_06020 [Sphingobium sp.]